MFGYYVLNPAQTSKFKIGLDPPKHTYGYIVCEIVATRCRC